jgi:hypothetical protein
MDIKKFKKRLDESFDELLTESMDMRVSDFNYPRNLETVGDVAHLLPTELPRKMVDKLYKNNFDAIAPDGHDYLEPKGILNFYVKMDEGSIEALQKEVYKVLKKYKIKHGKFGRIENSTSRDTLVTRLPILALPKDNTDKPPILNLSNTNADFVFSEILGFENQNYLFSFTVKELLNRLDSEEVKFKAGFDERKGFRQDEPDKVKIFDAGMNSNRIIQILERVREIALWAKKRGFTNLHVA